jgi:hypothetical protein
MPRHSPFALKDLKSHEFYQESVRTEVRLEID